MKKLLLSVALVAASFTTVAQVGVGTTNPDASAALEVQSIEKGFLPPRMIQAQIDDIASPAEGLMVYCLDCTPKGLLVYNGTEFVNVTGTAPVVDPIVDVAGQNGTLWMDRNLGATQQATSSTDAAAYGDLYQWGRSADGHQIRTTNATRSSQSATSTPAHGDFIIGSTDWLTTQDDTLWQAGSNDPCPSGYRIPTETELNNERLAFGTNNATGAYASALKLQAAGYRIYSNGTLVNVGSDGNYWSSSAVSGTDDARYLYFDSGNATMYSFSRALGYSVRCIKKQS